MTRRRGGRRGSLHCKITGELRGSPPPVNGGSRLYGALRGRGLTGTGAYGGWAYGVPVLTGDRGGGTVPVTGPP